jgi:hypothetical protein
MTPLAPFGALIIGLSVLTGLGSLAGLIYAIVEKNSKFFFFLFVVTFFFFLLVYKKKKKKKIR